MDVEHDRKATRVVGAWDKDIQVEICALHGGIHDITHDFVSPAREGDRQEGQHGDDTSNKELIHAIECCRRRH